MNKETHPHNRPKIDYPCEWEYLIIGVNEELLKSAATEILNGRKYEISVSKTSKTGKYISLAIKTPVENEATRNNIYAALSKHAAVTKVL